MDNTSPSSNTSTIPLFQYEGAEVRTVLIEGEAWFVAKDVCDILGLTNPTEAVRSLDDDEKNTLRISEGIQGRGNPNVNVISEPAAYKLVFRSNKPEAKVFLRWVTHEVLPQVMRSGSLFTYVKQTAPLLGLENISAVAFQMSNAQNRIKFWSALSAAFAQFLEIVSTARYNSHSDEPRHVAMYDEDALTLLRSILNSAEKLICHKVRSLEEKQEQLQRLIKF